MNLHTGNIHTQGYPHAECLTDVTMGWAFGQPTESPERHESGHVGRAPFHLDGGGRVEPAKTDFNSQLAVQLA